MNNARRFWIACAMVLGVGCGVTWHFLQTHRLKQRITVLEHAQMQSAATLSLPRPETVAAMDRPITASPYDHQSSSTKARAFYPAHALSYRGQRDVESTLQSMYWA